MEITGKYASQVDVVYRSPELVVLAPKNSTVAAKYSRNTKWCSQSHSGFIHHRRDEVLFRFLFKDGYKARLNVRNGGQVGHWGGEGGDNGFSYPICNFSRTIKNINHNINSEDSDLWYKNLINHIKMIPSDVNDKVLEYAKKNSVDEQLFKKQWYKILGIAKSIDPEEKCLSMVGRAYYNEDIMDFLFYFEVKNRWNVIGRFSLDKNGNIKTIDNKKITLNQLKMWLKQQYENINKKSA